MLKHNTGTQKGRVAAICSGRSWWTLKEIETAIQLRFGKTDTQAAISARLREFSPVKDRLTKEKQLRNGCKNLWEYRLTVVVAKSVELSLAA